MSLQLANGLVKTQNIQEFSYDGTGKIQACKHGGNVGTTSYQYNIRGQFSDIISSSFTEKLYYTDGLGIPRYNGNISSQQWKTADETIMRGYKFSYDNCNRLTNSIYAEREDMSYHLNRYNEEIVTYNANGAIKKIRRRGRKDDGIYGKIDDLTINLHGNQLMSVIDKSAPVNSYAAMDFKDGADDTKEYFYNGVGALVSDANKGIAHISYDNLNHPREIQFTNGGVIRYVYAPDGTKLRATYLTAIENIVVPINTTLPLQPAQILSEDSVEYLGDEVYENGALSKYLFTDGYASLETTTPIFHYFTKDHLGNIRTVVNEQGTLEQVTHYYPFGGIFADAGINQALQPYKFNGKELDRMHGLDWYDYGARMYDPVICTWTSYDSKASENVGVSPMAYCANNPINAIDPDGNDWYKNANGILLWQPNVNSHTKLPKSFSYVGEFYTDIKNGTFYRNDGSVLFTNETLAYNRMWTLSRKVTKSSYYPSGKEESAFILKNGNVLMLPDNWNDSMTSKMAGYSLKDKTLSKGKESYQVVGHVHTHPDGNADQGPSPEDSSLARRNPKIPFYILQGNNNVYGVIYFGKEKRGWANDNYLTKVSNILSGKISLFSITKRLSLK